MRIRKIDISESYTTKGHYECTISIDHDYGAVNLKLPEDRVNQIIDTVADLIVDGARDVADNLKRNAMQHQAIEHQPENGA